MFKKIKNLKPSKSVGYLLLSTLIFNAIVIGLGAYQNAWKFNTEFLKFNVLQIIIIYVVSLVLFFITYQNITKKRPSLGLLLAYTLLYALIVYILSGSNIALEQLFNKSSYVNLNTLFIYVGLIIYGLIVSHYDFPIIESRRKLYISVRDNMYKNLAMVLIFIFAVAYATLINETFIYMISAGVLLVNTYLAKALLSNLRK